VSQFSGKQDFSGPLKGRENKGVMKERKRIKRLEAEARQMSQFLNDALMCSMDT
jgi:hypothetical protein